MFLYRRISMLLLFVGCFIGLQADFISLSIWERTTPSGHKQHLICCGDKHDLISKADEQSDDLINWLEQRDNLHDVVLIEDQSDLTYIIEQAKEYLKIIEKHWDESCLRNVQTRYDDELLPFHHNTSGQPALHKVGQKLVDKKIKSVNVDFRCLALAADFWCLSRDWKIFLNQLELIIAEQVFREVQSYDDCLFLNEFYHKIRFSSSLSERRLLDTHNLLLDARLLHHIYQMQVQQKYANVVVVCAGARHNWRIEDKLLALGYTCIDRDGASSVNIKLSLSKRLKDSLDKLYLCQQEAETERKIKQARMKRRIKHILLGFDVDMDADDQRSPAKLQAKL